MAGGPIPLSDFLQCLVECSEKAARIAQIFRDEDDLFQLLVEEKSEVEKNKRFVQDFKTLADVLVQETIKRDVGKQFPSLISNIQGEEQNHFQNSLGESVSVELTSSSEDTAAMLSKVLDGRDNVAKALASVVHYKKTTREKHYSSDYLIPENTIGIWIDPIDSTAEYIQAKTDETEDHGIPAKGLKCVCVLIGAYSLENGNPILGVVNQPFYNRDLNIPKWESKFYWAVNYKAESATSPNLQLQPEQKRLIVLSNSESKQLQEIIASKYTIVHIAGAGHKCLLVACKKADLYVLSQGTTYFWDTCGPHALLTAQGGGMVKFDEIVGATDIKNGADLQHRQIRYVPMDDSERIESFRNAGGIIAYRDPDDVIEFLQLLHCHGYLPCKSY